MGMPVYQADYALPIQVNPNVACLAANRQKAGSQSRQLRRSGSAAIGRSVQCKRHRCAAMARSPVLNARYAAGTRRIVVRRIVWLPRGMPGTATAAGVQYARPSRLRDRHGWHSALVQPWERTRSGNISAPRAPPRVLWLRLQPLFALHTRQVECERARHEDPSGVYAGYPCWAREALGAGSRSGHEPALIRLPGWPRSHPTRHGEPNVSHPPYSGCGPFGPDPRCARLRQRERRALPHGLVREVEIQRRHRDVPGIHRPQIGALLRRRSGAARRPASSRGCPRCRGARRSAAAPDRACPGW